MGRASKGLRPRLSRTFSRARWAEYRRLLGSARERGYRIVPLEEWVRERGGEDPSPTLILRHDVDQHPASALKMAAIETDLGVRSTWYFRWRTADPTVIGKLRTDGFGVGLHYETLTRRALEDGLSGPPGERLQQEARGELRAEIAAFAQLFGPIRSVVPHGDSRVPGVQNSVLLHDEDCSDYGIEFDGNESMRGRGLAHWLTDRTTAEGRWGDGTDPAELFEGGVSPILCVTHPNNWTSGPSLWLDRILRAALPDPARGSESRAWGRPIRTGSDRPPL